MRRTPSSPARWSSTYIDPPGPSLGGSVGGTLTADASGNFALSWAERTPTIFTGTVVYQGQTLTKTVTVTCEPKPTTTAECKSGGWKRFGIIKNQGDCVSFVATGGKNPPALGSP